MITQDTVAEQGALSLDVNEEHPWVGLHEFTENIQSYFNGRTQETETLARMVRRRTLTVLFGQSGLGKSSLLQAGLFTRLRSESYLPVYIRLSYSEEAGTRPQPLRDQVMNAIAAAIQSSVEKKSLPAQALEAKPRPDETLWEYLHREPPSLSDAEGNPVFLVLAFDQFEEIFTLGRTSRVVQTEGQPFLKELSDCIENRVPENILDAARGQAGEGREDLNFTAQDYRFVFALREDYVAYLDDLSGIIPSVMENRMRLLPLNGRQALEAVLNPGRIRKDGEIVRELVRPVVARAIVRFVAASKRDEFVPEGENAATEEVDMEELRVDPALLSMVCRELNKKRIEAGAPAITAALLKEKNKTILADFYADCFKDPEVKPAQRFVEDHLLTAADFRDSMDVDRAKSELRKLGVAGPDQVIERLVKQRLLRVIERRSESEPERIELAHDVLTGVVGESRRQRCRAELSAAEERLRQEKDAAILKESEDRRRAAEAQARAAEERRNKAIRQLRETRRRQIVTLCLLGIALAGLAFGGFEKWRTWKKDVQDSSENYDYARRKACTFLAGTGSENGETFFYNPYNANDPGNDAIDRIRPRDFLSETRGDLSAMIHLAQALRLDPRNQNAATMTCKLLASRRWCPPVTPVMEDPDAGNPDKAILAAAWTPSATLAIVTRDMRLLTWDEAGGRLKVTGTLNTGVPGSSFAYTSFSPNGQWLLTMTRGATPGSSGAAVWTWNKETQTYETDANDQALPLANSDTRGVTAWSPDGHYLAYVVGFKPEEDMLLERSGPGATGTFVSRPLPATVLESKPSAVDFSPDGKYAAVASAAESAVQVWKVADLDRQPVAGKPEAAPYRVFTQTGAGGTKERISYVAFNPSLKAGDQFLTVSFETGVRIWNLNDTSQAILSVPQPRDNIMRAYYSPDGRYLLTATITAIGQVWDLNHVAPRPIATAQPGAPKPSKPTPPSSPKPLKPTPLPGPKPSKLPLPPTLSPVAEPTFYHDAGFICTMGFRPGSGEFFTGEGPVFNRPETFRVYDSHLNADNGAQLSDALTMAADNVNGPVPSWLPRLAEAVVGERFTQHGYDRVPDHDDPDALLPGIEKQFSQQGASGPYGDFGRAFFRAYGISQ